MTEEILIKRFDQELPLPAYKTSGAAAFDLCPRVTTTIQPKTHAMIPLNVAIKLPKGYWGLLTSRSSLHKKGVMFANDMGIIDNDYCGEEDEYRAVLYNISDQPVTLEKGERIVQVVLLPYQQFPIREVEAMEAANRGGFGEASGV